jgi:ATPase subunit of ABC transporter with duplicated ATPase domains
VDQGLIIVKFFTKNFTSQPLKRLGFLFLLMLKTNQLSFTINARTIFKNVNISLDSSSKKKVALVGRNGCGKSTLLKIITRELKPTSGDFGLLNEKIVYLPQEIHFPKDELVGEYWEKKLEEPWMESRSI